MHAWDACPCIFQWLRGPAWVLYCHNLVHKRHWPEFCIVTMLWIRGTGLIWVKRHWPEFCIVTILCIRGTGLIWVKRYWPEFCIVTMLWIRGTGSLWYYYNVLPFCHVVAEVFLQHVTVWRTVHTFYCFCCFLVTDVCLRPRLELHTG